PGGVGGRRRARGPPATLSAGLWPLDHVGFAAVAGELAEHYRRARQAAPADWHAASSEELHRLRQRVVVHRYQMELVEPLWPRLTKLWVAETQRLRERLGAPPDPTTVSTPLPPPPPPARRPS